MTGGSGTSLLGGAERRAWRDVLHGGSGHNTLYGGVGNDILYAGPLDDLLDGPASMTTCSSRCGKATMNGNRGNDKFTWKYGDGSPNIDGGGGMEPLGMTGSDGADSFLLMPINNARLQVGSFGPRQTPSSAVPASSTWTWRAWGCRQRSHQDPDRHRR